DYCVTPTPPKPPPGVGPVADADKVQAPHNPKSEEGRYPRPPQLVPAKAQGGRIAATRAQRATNSPRSRRHRFARPRPAPARSRTWPGRTSTQCPNAHLGEPSFQDALEGLAKGQQG